MSAPQTLFPFRLVRPMYGRSLRHALRYWRPKRLTLTHDSMGRPNPDIRAWLWWNFRKEASVRGR